MIGKRTFTNFLLSHESVSKLQFSSAGFLLCLVVKKRKKKKTNVRGNDYTFIKRCIKLILGATVTQQDLRFNE